MKHKLLLAFALISTMLKSQSVPMALEDWKTTAGTQNFYWKNVTKSDPSGNVYTAGATMNGGSMDILVAKYNAAGSLQWLQQFAGTAPNGVDAATGMYVTSTDVYITGVISNNSVTPETDCVTMKLSASTGSIVWSSVFTGAAGAHDAGKDITVDGSGNVYVLGASYNSSFNTDYLAIKYNSSGTQQWSNVWDYIGSDDAGYKIAVSGSNVNVTGAVTTATANTYKMATIKYSVSTGSLLATTVSTAVTTSSVDAVTDMVLDGSGNIIIVGSQYTGGQHDFYVQKLSASTLASLFVYTWDGGSSLNDYAKAVTTDAAGNIFVAGVSTSSSLGRELTVIKLNASGIMQNTVTSGYSGDDEASDIISDANGDVYLAGYKTSGSNKNYYTVKYSSVLAKLWETELDGNHRNDMATNIALDAGTNVIITGQSETTAPNTFEFLTVKYVQHDMVSFTDVNSEAIDPNLVYLPNKGQLLNTNLNHETDILYYNLTNYPETYLAKNRMSFLQFHVDTLVSTTDSLERIDMVFRGANPGVEIFNEDKGTDHDYNFFVGDVTATGLHGYNKLIYPNLYTGIDLHYYSNAYGFKAYFVVKPGADPRDIELLLQGQQSNTVTANNLIISGLLGDITLRQPNVYNIIGGINVPVTGTGWALNTNTVTFNVGSYVNTDPLVIEFSLTSGAVVFNNSSVGPGDNLKWCTYVGNTSVDRFQRMATDRENNKYMGGTSDGNNYPIFNGPFQSTNINGTAIVISKFTHLNQLLHSTYYGGTATSSTDPLRSTLEGIAVDSLQHVFFTGQTNNSNFPFPLINPAGSYDYKVNPTNGTNSSNYYISAYIVKLDSAMNTKLWGSHIGDTYFSVGHDVMVDANQNVTVTGESNSLYGTFHFPTAAAGSYYNTDGKGFIFRFSNNGIPQYATKMGARILRIEKNPTGGDYFVGGRMSTGDIGQYYKNPGGGAYYDSTVYIDDYYLARFNSLDNISWATVIGGTQPEYFDDMTLRDSTLILIGRANGAGFPIKYAPGQYVDSVHTNTGTSDFDVAFIRLNSYTGKHIYSSYYGGPYMHDWTASCVIDQNGNYYIGGNTYSTASNFDLQQSGSFYYNGNYHGNNGFILSYDKNNNKRFTTYFGRSQSGPSVSSNTYVNDMAVSPAGDFYIAGSTEANQSFPLYDASGIAYMDLVLNSPTGATTQYADAYIGLFTQPNASGIKDFNQSNTQGNVLVYPNPGHDVFNIEMDGLLTDKSINFKVYNTIGQIVWEDNQKPENGILKRQINLAMFSTGLYIINIVQENKIESVKIIKH
jgi:hypothetical protein